MLRQTKLNIADDLNAGQPVIFKSQWRATWGHMVDGHGDPAEPAEIINRQLRFDGTVFNYELLVDDGCTFWAAPWEVTPE